jgi:hypothetical protein
MTLLFGEESYDAAHVIFSVPPNTPNLAVA